MHLKTLRNFLLLVLCTIGIGFASAPPAAALTFDDGTTAAKTLWCTIPTGQLSVDKSFNVANDGTGAPTITFDKFNDQITSKVTKLSSGNYQIYLTIALRESFTGTVVGTVKTPGGSNTLTVNLKVTFNKPASTAGSFTVKDYNGNDINGQTQYVTSSGGAEKKISFLAEGTNTTGDPTVTFSARGDEMTTLNTSKGGNKYDVTITWTPKGYVDPAEVIDAYVKMPGCNDTKTVKLRLYYQKPATGGLTLEAIGGSIENSNGWRTWLSATSSNPQWVNNGRVVKEFNVRGSGLVGDIKLSVSPQGSYGLTVYPLTLPATGGKVTVIYSPKVGDVTGNNPVLTISNSNASPVTVALKTSWDKSTVAKVPALPTIKDGAFTPNIYECKTYKGHTTVSLRWELVNPDNIRLHVYSQTDINNESNADTKARMIEWNKIYNANTAFTYDVYRDGKLIVKELDITSYVDMNVSAGTSDKPIEHTYYVVAHYGNGNTKESGVKSVKLYRDMAISQYVLEEEYNYPIVNQETWNKMGQPADCFKAWGNDNGIHRESFLYKFNSAGTGDPYDTSKNKASGAPGDGVRQGVFYNGKWYIALVTDREAVGTADTKPNAIAIYGGMKDGEHGHILEIDAAKGVLNTTQVKSFQQLHTMTNQSLAVTSDGRFYFRADKENNVNGTTVAGDRYLDPIQSFGFYKSQYAKNLRWDDVMGLKAEADKHNKATETVNGEVRPLDSYIAAQYYRTHYMAARGKLTSNGSDPIKLCFAQNYSHDAYIIDMQDGWGNEGGLPNGTWHKLSAPRQVVTHRDGQERIIDIAAGTENYIFPVEGEPNKYIHVMRSSGIFLVDVTDINNPVYTLISSDQSEVTSASGLTFTLENSMAKSTDLFYIHVTSVHSNNTGHFRIDMPQRSKDGSGNYVGDIHTADFTDMVPMASKLQEEIPGFEAGNSNGMWFGVQDGEENGIKVKYIYQYVPGVRFAKYKFYPVQAFPPAQPNIDVVIRHDDPNMDATPHQADDITHFDVTYSWKRPANFGTLQGAAKNFKIDGYNVQLLDPNGNVIPGTQRFEKAKDGEDDYTVYGPFVYNQHAKPGSGNKNDFRPENGFNKDNAPGKGLFDVHDGMYTVNVTPIYVPTAGGGNRYIGETGVAQDDAKYTPEIYNIRAKLWQASGNSNLYRVDIDFNRAPRTEAEAAGNTVKEGNETDYTYRHGTESNASDYLQPEPASRFKIEVDKGDGRGFQPISNLRIVYDGNILYNPNDAAENAEATKIKDNFDLYNPGQTIHHGKHDGYVKHDYNFGGYFSSNGRRNVKARAGEGNRGDKMYAQEANHLFYGGNPSESQETQDLVNIEKQKGAFPVVAYHMVDGSKEDISNLYNWTYRATALYADNQPYESIKGQASVQTTLGLPTTTGVDDVTADAENGGVHIWPVPAESELHISAGEAIETVSIVNISGACVATFEGNNDTAMTVNVDNLASGVYLVKVNANAARRLIKR